MIQSHRSNGGYIALISAVTISAILLAITAALGYTAFFARYNMLDSEYKEMGSALAEACAETALLKLANDSTYTGNEVVTVSSSPCTIRPVSVSGGQVTIEVQSIIQNTYTNLEVVAASGTLGIISWQEIANF
jgi:Tfp pilus assembly protein PilV